MAYKNTIADTIIGLLKTNLGSSFFKQYYYGDPWIIPQSSLPCVCVDTVEERTIQDATGMDMVVTRTVIKLLANKKDDFNKAANEVVTKRKLEEWATSRDSSTGEHTQNSVVGILRTNFTMGVGVDNQEITVKYTDTVRNPDLITSEAQIEITTAEIVAVSSRT